MAGLKEITVFTLGDANKLSTWSNVPYFFTKSFEEKNIKVNKVNIEENHFLNLLYKYSVFIFFKLFYKNSDHTYFRSGLNYFLTNLKILRAKKKYVTSEAFIFLTYSFSCKKNESEKIILFGDWSYLYLIKKMKNRNRYWFEKNALQREEKNISSAELALSLFPGSFEFNQENYPKANCQYLGNVINTSNTIDKQTIISSKLKSNSFLFIGNKKYLQGALDLIEAFRELKKKNKAIELHIIGLEASATGLQEQDLFYYGYLDKGNEHENKNYYKLLSSAKFIVNTTKGWGAFSAMTEAMYYYTPVITTPYNEFVKSYGENIDFGAYVKNDSPLELAETLEKLSQISEDEYVKMMEDAHEKVKAFTWKAYIEKLTKLIS